MVVEKSLQLLMAISMEVKLHQKEDGPRVLKVLEALKQASHELQTHPIPHSNSSSAINALLELETESDNILSRDPQLSALSQHLATLKTLVESLRQSSGHLSIRSFLTRCCSTHCLSKLARSIESEIQAWIDRECLHSLTRALEEDPIRDEDKLIKLLTRFEDRVAQGFNHELQDLILKSKIVTSLESVLCESTWSSKRVKEHIAFAIAALIKFNKDVFVGQVLIGRPTISSLIKIASPNAIRVLCALVRLIKSPLVDEIEFNGEIPNIISFLNSEDLEMRVMAMVCVFEIGYFGRKEAIDAMLQEGLIEKLVELQRSEHGGDLMRESREKGFLESHPFSSCVARFTVQLEVGEGLRQRERRAFKQQILVRVREASISDAEAATIFAEVLWGASP
ncbi:uncharacterized protein LOC126604210 isoform X1 [Malus sylvestris]|uniref:uncharacterized protein LOC126604210 isoform X1 n=2 Tax=Malus sylvestris TaxID=3752 RepID=UPI0021AC0167|nr:uncharacterized protein LOC126604210 isoform X1 [Malus sylvestris]